MKKVNPEQARGRWLTLTACHTAQREEDEQFESHSDAQVSQSSQSTWSLMQTEPVRGCVRSKKRPLVYPPPPPPLFPKKKTVQLVPLSVCEGAGSPGRSVLIKQHELHGLSDARDLTQLPGLRLKLHAHDNRSHWVTQETHTNILKTTWIVVNNSA